MPQHFACGCNLNKAHLFCRYRGVKLFSLGWFQDLAHIPRDHEGLVRGHSPMEECEEMPAGIPVAGE